MELQVSGYIDWSTYGAAARSGFQYGTTEFRYYNETGELVVIEGRELTLWPVRFDPSGHRLAERPRFRMTLGAEAVARRVEGRVAAA